MKLRNIIYSAAMAAVAITLGSCTPIDENERLIEVEKPQANRAVLIEDFTGQYCPNCPNATDEIQQLTEVYGSDKIIAVAVHSGPQGFHVNNSTPQFVGLMTDLGQEYYKSFEVDYQPQGKIDRGGNLAYTDWAARVRSELEKVALLNIRLVNDYSETSRKLTITSQVQSVKGINQIVGKLQVWLIEDGITSIQALPSGSYDLNYVHNHVLRDAVNGTWGEDVTLNEDASIEKIYSYDIPANWNPAKMSVVAFVYNDNGVQQVVKMPVIQK